MIDSNINYKFCLKGNAKLTETKSGQAKHNGSQNYESLTPAKRLCLHNSSIEVV